MSREREVRLELEGGAELACRWLEGRDRRVTILYLHGFNSSQAGEKAEFFRRRASAEGYGFFSLDFRGHGRSGGDLRDLTLTRCLADVAAARSWLADRGVSRLALMGSSMGGLVGLWHAALTPRRIAAAVFLAPAVGLGEDLADRVGEEGMLRWRQTGEIEFENELGVAVVGWPLVEDLARHPTDRLAELHRTPSRIYQGRRDDRVSWRRVAGFARGAGEAVELEVFADGDHRLLDRREEIWAGTVDFLAAHATFQGRAP